MRWFYLRLLMAALLALAGCGDDAETRRLPPAAYKDVSWAKLIPKNWDPGATLRGLDFSNIKDSDPRAIKALLRVQKAWTKAPVNPKMNGALISIAGYIAPLDNDREHLREFLLVPFFGGCIHTPPPPGNQIIHVLLSKSISLDELNSAVVVSGKLETVPSNTALGFAGYRMAADSVVAYTFNK